MLEQFIDLDKGILVVDDCSKDDTIEVALNYPVVLLKHIANLGQWVAFQTGFDFILKKTAAKYIITFDSDGQHQTRDISALLDPLKSAQFDVVLGSRFEVRKMLREYHRLKGSCSRQVSSLRKSRPGYRLRILIMVYGDFPGIHWPRFTSARIEWLMLRRAFRSLHGAYCDIVRSQSRSSTRSIPWQRDNRSWTRSIFYGIYFLWENTDESFSNFDPHLHYYPINSDQPQ